MSFRNREKKSRQTSKIMKEDIDLKDINEPEELGLDQKMDWLMSKQKYHFKREISYKRQHILNLITEQQQSSTTKPTQPSQQQSTISNNTSSLQDAIPKILLDQGDSKHETQCSQSKFFKLNKEALSPSVPNRFTSKKRSQFSYYSNDSQDSNLELHLGKKQDSNNQLSETRKERSKFVSNTLNQYNQQYLLKQSKNQINKIKRNNPQSSLLQLELSDKSKSQSSLSTPKSILKNPSSLNSSRLSFCSLQLGSQLNTQSPSKKRKVKFCLTKQQARRENIPC